MDGRSVWVISLQLPVVLAHHATPAPERTTRVCDVLWVLIEAVGTRGAHGLTQFAAGVRFWSVVQVVLDLDGLPQLVNREVREAIERVTVAVLHDGLSLAHHDARAEGCEAANAHVVQATE